MNNEEIKEEIVEKNESISIKEDYEGFGEEN